MLSTAASLGMLLLWDVDGGLTQIDKYLYSTEDYIKVSVFNDSFFYVTNKFLFNPKLKKIQRKSYVFTAKQNCFPVPRGVTGGPGLQTRKYRSSKKFI